MNLKPRKLKNKACLEGYKYFDVFIRKLPKKQDGSFDESNPVFANSDVDAYRHAYVSAIFTHEYGAAIADLFGRLNELTSHVSPGASPGEKNMDLWNNEVGRRYGKKIKDKQSLQKALHDALIKGELIITPKDVRVYNGAAHIEPDPSKPVIVLDENDSGRNEVFYDIVKKKVLKRAEFVAAITNGSYPGYLIKNFNGLDTPVSKSDGNELNNLG